MQILLHAVELHALIYRHTHNSRFKQHSRATLDVLVVAEGEEVGHKRYGGECAWGKAMGMQEYMLGAEVPVSGL